MWMEGTKALRLELDNKIMKIPQTIRGDKDFSTAMSVPLIAIMKNKLAKKRQEVGKKKARKPSGWWEKHSLVPSCAYIPQTRIRDSSTNSFSFGCFIQQSDWNQIEHLLFNQKMHLTSDHRNFRFVKVCASQKFQKHRCSWGDLCLVQLETAKQLGKYTCTENCPQSLWKMCRTLAFWGEELRFFCWVGELKSSNLIHTHRENHSLAWEEQGILLQHPETHQTQQAGEGCLIQFICLF